jgi:hypothetical protein
MRYFTNSKREHSGHLFQRSVTNNPLRVKLEAIKKIKRSGLGIFAPKITAADIEQHQPIVNDDQ